METVWLSKAIFSLNLKPFITKSHMGIIHISIDDVIYVFKELTDTKPSSIFDVHFFHYFKRLHDKYGAVVSCYCFYRYADFTLASCTRIYRAEFEANSDWLRFGFHGYSGEEDYGTQDEGESKRQYDQVMNNLAEIVGIKSLDSTTRIHRFRATKEFMMYIRHAKYPVCALLGADDNRLSYSLSVEENRVFTQKRYLNVNDMRIIRTTQRFDHLKPLAIFHLFTHLWGDKYFFTHEYYFFPASTLMKIKGMIIKSLIQMTVIYYRYCLFCVCDFPVNNK